MRWRIARVISLQSKSDFSCSLRINISVNWQPLCAINDHYAQLTFSLAIKLYFKGIVMHPVVLYFVTFYFPIHTGCDHQSPLLMVSSVEASTYPQICICISFILYFETFHISIHGGNQSPLSNIFFCRGLNFILRFPLCSRNNSSEQKLIVSIKR